LSLVGFDVDNENKSVVLLNLLHGALSVERVDNDLVFIEAGLMRNRLARVLGVAGELKGLGSVEGGRKTDLADLVGVSALQSSLSSSAGLLVALAFGGSTCKTYASAIALEELAISATAVRILLVPTSHAVEFGSEKFELTLR